MNETLCIGIHLGEKLAKLIADNRIAKNFVARCVVDKLNLHVESHPHSYKVTLKGDVIVPITKQFDYFLNLAYMRILFLLISNI